MVWPFGAAALRAQGSVDYPSGWNLISGPQGSYVVGATGSLYALLPGDTDYETFPVTTPLQGGAGYWAYFSSGGSVNLAAGTSSFSERLAILQWVTVGNPSDTGTAFISGDIEDAQTRELAPGQGTFVLSAGLVIISVQPSSAPPVGQDSSGIEGTTAADPQCPIVLPGRSCPPKPISATVAVLDPSGNEVARFTSAGNGSFRVSVPPGTYTLVEVVAQPGAPPSLKPVKVTVPSGQYVSVLLLFDTGIR